MIKCRFKKGAGRHIGIVDGKAKSLEAGDEVELTENQADKFADKFERVEKSKPGGKDDDGKKASDAKDESKPGGKG